MKTSEGPSRQPSPVKKVAVIAPYGTSFGSVAARPAMTPLLVPIRPPNTIAERGLSSPTALARKGVKTMTRMAFTRPAAMLSAMTSLLAPMAAPVTGPTM